MVWALIIVAAIWGYHRGIKSAGATRGRVVLLAGIASAAVATVLVIYSGGEHRG
ncbi:MAG: hypothetical protein IPN16_20575 [Gemmatimonadetes bacterium]|nr:hypothetical protein [Gemmatimonadota bacterium]